MEHTQSDIITLFSEINKYINLEKCMKDALDYLDKIPLAICRLVYPGTSEKIWEKELPLEIAQATRSPMVLLKDIIKQSLDIIFVDTRTSEEYNKLRVSGSINLPIKTGNDSGTLPTIKLTQAQLEGLKNHAKGKVIVLIGDGSLKANSVWFI